MDTPPAENLARLQSLAKSGPAPRRPLSLALGGFQDELLSAARAVGERRRSSVARLLPCIGAQRSAHLEYCN
jgi:hypothetical protein